MTDDFESLYRFVFFSSAASLVLLERMFQRPSVAIAGRWTSNIGLLLIGSIVSGLVLPMGIHAYAQEQPPGLLSQLGLSFAAQASVTFVFLDVWRYWEHRLYHRVHVLWRLHLVHHTDTQVDVTTSERHHPLEVLLSTAVMMLLISTLGLPAQALAIYLLIATVFALLSHANVRLPDALDRRLRLLFVTPAVHAVHHSDLRAQTDSNYGAVLTVWDRLFGTYVDPQIGKIKRFGLSYFHLPGHNALAGVLQQPFWFREGLVYPERSDADAGEASSARSRTELSRDWTSALLAGAAGFALALPVLWSTWQDMFNVWRTNEAYHYGWLVLPMVAYLLAWHDREHSLAVSPRPDYTGVLVAACASVCWVAAALMNIDVGRQFALVLALQGIAMSMLGWRPYWRLFPILALMFLMVPSGDVLQPLLRDLTVKAIEVFAVVADLPHTVDGFVIHIGAQRYVVVDECSGLANVILGSFLGYCFGLLLYRSLVKIAALSLFGALLGMLSNMLRVNAIVLIDWVRGSQMELAAHGSIQWISLLFSLGLLFYVFNRLKGDATSGTPVTVVPGRASAAARYAPVAAGLSVLLIVGSVNAPSTDATPSPRETKAPQGVLGWRLATPAPAWEADPVSQSELLTLTYGRSGRVMRVLVVTPLSPNAKLTESRLAPGPGNDWRENRVEKRVGCIEASCLTLMHRTWQRGKSAEHQYVYYAYGIGSYTTESRLALRAMHAWHRIIRSGNDPQLIGVIVEDAPLADDEAAAVVRTFRTTFDAARNAPKHATRRSLSSPL